MPPLRKPPTLFQPPEPHPLFQAIDLSQKTRIRNIQLHGRRTSLRLEPDFWDAIELIAKTEKRPLSDIMEKLDVKRGAASLTGAIRIFCVNYFYLQLPWPPLNEVVDTDQAIGPATE